MSALDTSLVFAGKNLTCLDDKLVGVTLAYLQSAIKNPKPAIVSKFNSLRIIKGIDRKRFNACKRELPYFVCSHFSPSIRRKENFLYTEFFILDIDKIQDKGLDFNAIRQKVTSDSRVVMVFKSPSEEGLKLMFHLKDKCYDAGKFTLFYKEFAQKFSELYSLEQVLDTVTCDVSRACFISIDSDIYVNYDADSVDMNDFIDTNSFEQSHIDTDVKIKTNNDEEETIESKEKGPDEEQILRIKEILKMKITKKPEKDVYVPSQLETIIEEVKNYLVESGISITEVINISYGKKIRGQVGLKSAEVNLFYGKKGYTIVKSPRCGTNPELNDLLVQLLTVFINEYKDGKKEETC